MLVASPTLHRTVDAYRACVIGPSRYGNELSGWWRRFAVFVAAPASESSPKADGTGMKRTDGNRLKRAERWHQRLTKTVFVYPAVECSVCAHGTSMRRPDRDGRIAAVVWAKRTPESIEAEKPTADVQ